MKKITVAVVTAACALTLAAPSYAATLATEDALGQAGKGEVTSALGLKNNAEFQAVADQVSFALVSTTTTSVHCEKLVEIGPGGPKVEERETKLLTQDRVRTAGVAADVLYDTKGRKQVAGYRLGALTNVVETASGPNPVCPSGFDQVGEAGTTTVQVLTVSAGTRAGQLALS
jgi:hypothetical protein